MDDYWQGSVKGALDKLMKEDLLSRASRLLHKAQPLMQPTAIASESPACPGAPSSPASHLEEILVNILQFLPPRELAYTIPLVSRLWRQVTLSSDLLWSAHLGPSVLLLCKGHSQTPSGSPPTLPSPPLSSPLPQPPLSSSVPSPFSQRDPRENPSEIDHPSDPPAANQLDGLPANNQGGGVAAQDTGPAVSCQISYPKVYLALHGCNFLKNPTFSKSLVWVLHRLGGDSRRAWTIRDSGSGSRFEAPPEGLLLSPTHPLPTCLPYPTYSLSSPFLLKKMSKLLALEEQGCLATHGHWVELAQVVPLKLELHQRGLTPPQASALLDSSLTLAFSIHVATHVKDVGHFAVGLLMDDGEGPVPSMQSFVAKRRGALHYFSGVRVVQAGRGWYRFSHQLTIPIGARRAVLLLRGRGGTPDSEGYAGIKFAAAELTFLVSGQRLGEENLSESHLSWSEPLL